MEEGVMKSPTRRGRHAAWVLLAAGLAPWAPVGATTVTLNVDFEAPTYATGAINSPATNPNLEAGQGGWGGFSSAAISTAHAHSGTQSMFTQAWTGFYPAMIYKPLSGGSYAGINPNPGAVTPFSIGAAQDWWVQAHVLIERGGSARMALQNGLGACPLLDIGSNAPSAAGVPHVNGCITDATYAPLGDALYDQWLRLEMIHTAGSAALTFRINGNGIDRTMTLSAYGGPGSTAAVNYLGLAGAAYWDDIRAGTGALPTAGGPPPVGGLPEPASLWLAAVGLAGAAETLHRRARR